MDNPTTFFMDDRHANDIEDLSQGHLSIARAAWLQGDFDTARMAYQKAAYVSPMLTDAGIKEALKRELTGFAQRDPLYREVMAEILPVVKEYPGIKQTELYGFLSVDREVASYVLYFATEIFELVRKKSGRTYQLFPPGHMIEQSV